MTYETDKFPVNNNLPKQTKETEHLNSSIKDFELVSKTPLTKEVISKDTKW